MLECRLGRDRLMRQGARFTTRRGKNEYDLPRLEALAAREPERFSPNVLLRPVVESALLPTVAYLGGPGELRYLALTPPVYAGWGSSRSGRCHAGRASWSSRASIACWRSSASA